MRLHGRYMTEMLSDCETASKFLYSKTCQNSTIVHLAIIQFSQCLSLKMS